MLALYLGWLAGETLFALPVTAAALRAGVAAHPGGGLHANLVPFSSIGHLLSLGWHWPTVRLLAGNVIVFASLDKAAVTPADLRERAKKIVKDRDFGFDLAALIEKEYNLYTGQTNNEKPLTDDMAPVDTLRRENPKFFEEEAKRP